eukprot:6937784-Pyramimonas_sp.AAC.1
MRRTRIDIRKLEQEELLRGFQMELDATMIPYWEVGVNEHCESATEQHRQLSEKYLAEDKKKNGNQTTHSSNNNGAGEIGAARATCDEEIFNEKAWALHTTTTTSPRTN